MKKIVIYGLLGALLHGGTSCTDTRQEVPVGRRLEIRAEIIAPQTASTKATIGNSNGTGATFETGDKIGLYATSMENRCLTNDGRGVFSDDLGNGITDLQNAFAYYPYSENIASDGLSIRDDEGKVIDFLAAPRLGGANGVVAAFYHGFSMLLIKPEEGFDQATTQEVTVTLTRPAQVVKLKDGPITLDGFKFHKEYYIEGDENDEEQKKFKALLWEEYAGTGNTETGTEGGKIYYVLLPTGVKEFSEVESITLKDNAGNERTIFNDNKLASLEPHTRYPVTIRLEKLVPTLFPTDIEEWEEEEINQENQVGINDLAGFKNWIATYNSYKDDAESANDENLKPYGNKDENGKWTFFLKTDLDLSEEENLQIQTFTDKLVGNGHILRNLGLKAGGLFNTIDNGAEIANLHLDNVKVTSDTNPDNNDPEDVTAGTFVRTLKNGTFTYCSAKNIRVEAEGVVGALAGKIDGNSTVSHCTFSGILIGSNTTESKIAGSGEGTQNDNNTANVIFTTTGGATAQP